MPKMKDDEERDVSFYEKQGERLIELFEKIERIRSQMASDDMIGSFEIPEGKDFNSVMEAEAEAVTEGLDEKQGGPIRQRLREIAIGLGKNASEVRDGDTEGNEFYFSSGPAAGMINFTKVDKANAFLCEVKSLENVAPKIAAFAEKLQRGVERLKLVDPARAQGHEVLKACLNSGGKMDMKPLRVLGAVLGGLITMFGLGRNAYQIFKGETPDINAATLGWAGLTMLCINPGFFMTGAPEKAIERLKGLDTEGIRVAVKGGFKGPDSKKALEELQDIAQNDSTLLKELMNEKKLNDVQIVALTGDAKSPLAKVLLGMEEDKQPKALLALGGRTFNDGEIELLEKLMLG
jgi:hypothetical protein